MLALLQHRSEIVHAMMNLLLRYWDLIKHTLVLLSTPSFCEAFKIQAYAMMTQFIQQSISGWMNKVQHKFQFNLSKVLFI